MSTIPRTMKAVVTKSNGGYEQLQYQDVPVPELLPGTVLLKVLSAGVNNTDINTRLGWYAAKVKKGTLALSSGEIDNSMDGGWKERTPFPLIQGTDCCGRVVAVGSGQDAHLLNSRVLVRPCMRSSGWESLETIWLGSDCDGAFAEYVRVPSPEVFPVDCEWSDEELGTIPCAYGTAENMLHRASVQDGDIVLVRGSSGGVGSAVVQLAGRRGARVIAVTSKGKKREVASLAVERVITHEELASGVLPSNSVDVVVDNVAGPDFGEMLNMLKRGGCLVTSGAIAGAQVTIDLRSLYLKDLRLIGCTAWAEPVFRDVISYIEQGEIRPLLAGVFPMEEIAAAQQEFSRKHHVGKLVLLPHQV
ncbi:zinc-binding dehydrogenase [uncultured Sphaerochaeta sp.]|uniref:zinc-binding dehydrogenase n=1 Tax=uncultured Sphaerochaeta sp. TaxID=886478 RepID=UPI002AA76A3B|nr:zinc-binding dehydrogenase [uncultured Sphaerochaeta sp.]